MKRYVCSFILLLTSGFVFAQTEPLVTKGNFVTRGTVLVSYTGRDKAVTIPDNLGITEIGASVFGHAQLESVVIPTGVISIGKSAFASCYSLKSVTIPNTVKVIDDNAFNNCGLITVRIPESVIVIGRYAFSCDKLSRITMPADLLYIATDAIPNNFAAAYINSRKRAGNYVYSRGFQTWYTGSDPIPQAITITPGTPVQQNSGDAWFRVAIPDGGATVTTFTEGNTDTRIWLYDLTGNELSNDDDSGSNYNARTGAFVQTQTAYIRVSGRGAYSVNVSLE